MSRHILAMVAALGLLAASTQVKGDDLGKLLDRATRNGIRQAIVPRNSGPQPGNPRGAAVDPRRAATENRIAGGEPVVTKTRDGWNLVAQHFRPVGQPKAGAMPVILCHGLTYNAQFWDLDPSCGFAQYLAGLGYDVWAVDLRGSGMSQKWVWRLEDAPEVLIGGALRRMSQGKLGTASYASVDPKYANWNMDHHIAMDVPALVQMVRRRTGAPAVAWVGHSMGGIVALACLARYENPGIGCLVTVGSQVTMPEGQVARQFLTEMLQTRSRQLAGELTGEQIVSQTRTSVYNLFFNEQNVSPKVYEALSGWATDIPAIGLMQQYMLLSNKGVLLDAKGQFNYAQAIGNVKVPIFISCGQRDNFAPPRVQKFLFDHVGSTDKTLYIFGRAQGLPVDAGHDDALVGLNSKATSYPVIARWLEAHVQAQPPQAP
ncbi:alpha/beta hydrolase [Singulisphaera sp. PoT]|uniref:alpha/beta hydrolase n=1 Tax=Singulisphaera sp. PoT TaxID=3411797 RepID=UPI003BF49C5B